MRVLKKVKVVGYICCWLDTNMQVAPTSTCASHIRANYISTTVQQSNKQEASFGNDTYVSGQCGQVISYYIDVFLLFI